MAKKNFKVDNVMSSNIPNDIRTKSSWGSRFDQKSGFAFKLPYDNTAAVFLDKQLTTGKYNQIMEVFGKEAIAAKIITCEKKEWTVNTELA